VNCQILERSEKKLVMFYNAIVFRDFETLKKAFRKNSMYFQLSFYIYQNKKELENGNNFLAF
jgi:hypothetical protein